MSKIVSIVIPVYNERNTFLDVLEAVYKSDTGGLEKEVIVVDDYSTDGTRELLSELKREGVKIFFNAKNIGKGFSVRTGLAKSMGDFVIIQDADLEYNPNEYLKLLKPLISGEAEVVYGSRFLNSSFIFKTYYIANRFLTWFSNIFTGLNLTDMETCYKCFTRAALKKILPSLSANRFEIEPEITAAVSKSKFKVKEIPISYQRRSYNEGKKIGWRDGVKAIIAIIKYSL